MIKLVNSIVNEFFSCEWFAHIITYHFTLRNRYDYIHCSQYPSRSIEISVSEDNENGATIQYNLTYPSQSIVI